MPHPGDALWIQLRQLSRARKHFNCRRADDASPLPDEDADGTHLQQLSNRLRHLLGLTARDRTVLASEKEQNDRTSHNDEQNHCQGCVVENILRSLGPESMEETEHVEGVQQFTLAHKVTHVALPNPDRSNRVAVAKRLSQVRSLQTKLLSSMRRSRPILRRR